MSVIFTSSSCFACACEGRHVCAFFAALLILSNDKPEVTATLNASCRCVFAGWCRRSAGTDRPPGSQGWTWWALLCRTLHWGRYTTPFLSFSFTSPPCSPLNIFSFSSPLRHKQNITQNYDSSDLRGTLTMMSCTCKSAITAHAFFLHQQPGLLITAPCFQLWQWNTAHVNSPLW